MLNVFNSTSGAPYHQWGPPSLDAAATPSLRHWFLRVWCLYIRLLTYLLTYILYGLYCREINDDDGLTDEIDEDR